MPMMMAAGAELSLQQPQLLVSAGAGQRLRDRAHPHHRARRRSTASPAASSSPVSRRSFPARTRRRTASCTSSRRRSRCAISRSSSAASRAPRPRRSRFRPRTPRRRRSRRAARYRQPEPRRSKRTRGRRSAAASSPSAPPTSRRSTSRSSAIRRIRASPSRSSKATCRAATAPATSRRSTSRCRPRSWSGATIRRRSPTIPISSSRTSSRTSGGARRSAGGTTTSSGSAKASRSTSPRCTRSTSAATRRSPSCCGSCGSGASTTTDQGPVYLGYRLGHIRGDSRVFRALVYNKGAAVLHMLRRLVGDDAFFRGLRRFYRDSRFRKAGTEDFRRGDGSGVGPVARALLRALDLRLDAAAAEVQLPRRGHATSCCASNRSARSSTCRSR